MQGLLALGLGGGYRFKLLVLLARPRLRLLFARADEIEMEGGRLGRTLRPARGPGLGLNNIVAEQQPVRRSTARVPLGRALKVAGVLSQPCEVGVERSDQTREPGAEARARRFGVQMKKDVVEVPQPRWGPRVLQRSAV